MEKKDKWVKISEERRNFAGLQFSEEELVDLSNMSLKEYLVKRDMRNYRLAHGLEEDILPDSSKKRKYEEIDVDEPEET